MKPAFLILKNVERLRLADKEDKEDGELYLGRAHLCCKQTQFSNVFLQLVLSGRNFSMLNVWLILKTETKIALSKSVKNLNYKFDLFQKRFMNFRNPNNSGTWMISLLFALWNPLIYNTWEKPFDLMKKVPSQNDHLQLPRSWSRELWLFVIRVSYLTMVLAFVLTRRQT